MYMIFGLVVAFFLCNLFNFARADIVEGSTRLRDALREWQEKGYVSGEVDLLTSPDVLDTVAIDSSTLRLIFPPLIEDKFLSSLVKSVAVDDSFFVEETVVDSLWLLDGMVVPDVAIDSKDAVVRRYIAMRAAQFRSIAHRLAPFENRYPEAIVEVGFVGRDVEYFTFSNKVWTKIHHRLGQGMLCYAFITRVVQVPNRIAFHWAVFLKSAYEPTQHYMEIVDKAYLRESVEVDSVRVRFIPGVRTDNVAQWFAPPDTARVRAGQPLRLEIKQ